VRRRILLVDDYRDALEMWGFYLRACGYEVLTATDGLQAVAAAQESRPDVIVLDLDLPDRLRDKVKWALAQLDLPRAGLAAPAPSP
jgi:CheY-like chemotaxis protein